MLAMSDTNIERFLPVFAQTGVNVAFLVPTPTGYGKSIMDAISPVRELLKHAGVHDYEAQRQGQEAKVMAASFFVRPDRLVETAASLYRPMTKKGDPRIWFSRLRDYCSPCNLLALVVIEQNIYVFNLSDPALAASLEQRGYAYDLLQAAAHRDMAVARELLHKLRAIHDRGFLPSVTPGDPSVGDTLEHALGIRRNNSKAPDFKGIELKTTRLTRNGSARTATRSTLFTKVPDEGLTYRQIVETYGKYQVPKGMREQRLQLYETVRASRPNAYGLLLEVDENNDRLYLVYQDGQQRKQVSAWLLSELRETLLRKHRETFWVKAVSETRNGVEHFRYDKVLHTRNPNASLLAPLLEMDKITVDLAAHFDSRGKWRDHGMLFKIKPEDLNLLFGEPVEYDLTQ